MMQQFKKNNAIAEISHLKQQPGKNMVLSGSLSLAQSLMKADLIDEFYLRICPSFLGSGKPLFPADTTTKDLQLFETKVYDSGMVLLCYKPLSDK